MKNWSFGKLLAVFCGSFLVIIVIAIVIMKMSASPTGKKVAYSNSSQQKPQQTSEMDVISLQLNASQKQAREALLAQENSQSQLVIVRQEMQRNNKIMLDQLAQMASKMNEITQRMDLIETSRGRVDIVKPPRRAPQASAAATMAKNGTHLPESSGYKVQATVGDRAWIRSGNKEFSVKPGDKMPATAKELRVNAVDNDSGLVITSPSR